MRGERIRVRGLVQGVGFRPTVWRVANALGLRGNVINDGEGVLVNAWGPNGSLDAFCDALHSERPPLARIDSIERIAIDDAAPEEDGFSIQASEATAARTGIVADAATCEACRQELFAPDDRRYRYAFTNCTHCGPRLSIVKGIPYDRANTSMSVFTQCPACQAEYDDPADRRFHAQPNACPECGPQVWLEDAKHRLIADSTTFQDAIAAAAARLAAGQIVAIKGIGGFHLACDASQAEAVDELRKRKRRDAKPFALMVASVEQAARFVALDDTEKALLSSTAAPIVLAERRADASELPHALAPDQTQLGFMLPYSPLHQLLLADWQAFKPGMPLVMTSGNLSDEPQCTDNTDASDRLREIADCWLVHDREIVNRVDDSVVRVDLGKPRFLRRARGYAPAPIAMPQGFEAAPPLLALGGELKNTFCLLQDGNATLSQHLGDLEDARTSDAWERSLALYRSLFQHSPQAIAVDLHPDYRSTRYGQALAERENLDLIEVQHHHAHIASVLADNAWPLDGGPVLGIALDGLGMGTDGTLWGGEFLKADYLDFSRAGFQQPVPLPGGTKALLEPWRNTWAHLATQVGWQRVCSLWPNVEIVEWLSDGKPLAVFEQMVERGLNSPLSSGAGRLFDAVAGALGLCRESISHEGQAAIALENAARRAPDEQGAYRFPHTEEKLELTAFWEDLLSDLRAGVDVERISARFHNGLAKGIGMFAIALCDRMDLDTVALSGGVFQNRTLFTRLHDYLSHYELKLMSHSQVPSNDGGISLGQAAIAAARLLQR